MMSAPSQVSKADSHLNLEPINLASADSYPSLELVSLASPAAPAEHPLSLSTSSKGSAKSIGIVFDDLNYKIIGKKKEEKSLITSATGRVQPGRLTAIMGASGAGKTTFLNLLSGRIKASKEKLVTGQVRVNGVENKNVQRISGYVMQEDVLLPHLVRVIIAIRSS